MFFGLALAALPARAEDETTPARLCADAFASCREDCTIEFGTSIKLRPKLAQCLGRCEKKNDGCLEEQLDLHRANVSTPEKPKEADSPTSASPAPKPSAKKKEEKPKEATKKEEKKPRPLDEWDPDAL